MNPLTVNPTTGFLESVNPGTMEAFTSDKKVEFLECARAYAEQRQYPHVAELCKKFNITYRSFHDHLQKDDKFAAAWDEIKKNVYSGLTNELSIKANSKNGIVANIAMLKFIERGKFSDDEPILNADNSRLKGILQSIIGFKDAEIVDTTIDHTPVQ